MFVVCMLRTQVGTDLYTVTFFIQLITFMVLALTFEQGGSTFVQVSARSLCPLMARFRWLTPLARAIAVSVCPCVVAGHSKQQHFRQLRVGAVWPVHVHCAGARRVLESLVPCQAAHSHFHDHPPVHRHLCQRGRRAASAYRGKSIATTPLLRPHPLQLNAHAHPKRRVLPCRRQRASCCGC